MEQEIIVEIVAFIYLIFIRESSIDKSAVFYLVED